MSDSDLALLELWRKGRDADSFAAIVARHSAMVYSTCCRILKDSTEAEDVSQECFLKLAGGPRAERTHSISDAKPALPHRPPTQPRPSIRGAISGVVYDAEDGEGIPDVIVGSEGTATASAKTDEEGKYRFENLEAGDYVVQWEAVEGFVSPQYSRNSGQKVSLSTGQNLEGIDFALTIGADLVGLVVGGDGKPVSGAEVKIGCDSPPISQKTASGEDGVFSFAGLPPEIRIHVKAIAGERASVEAAVDLPAEGIAEITLVLAATGTISGILRDDSGNPLPNFWVRGEDREQRYFGEKEMGAKTDEMGNFSLASFPEGTYTISGMDEGTGRSLGTEGFRVLRFPQNDEEAVIRLRSGEQVSGLSLVYKDPGRAISGRVLTEDGRPVAGVSVHAQAHTGGSGSAETDETGSFEIAGLTASSYMLQCGHPEHGRAAQRAVLPGTRDLELRLHPGFGYEISGRVIHARTGEPIPAFEVLCRSDNSERFDTSSLVGFVPVREAEGRFRFDRVDPGWVTTVVARAPGFKSAVKFLELSPGDRIEDIVLALEPGGSLRGAVMDEAGKSVPEAAVVYGRPTMAREKRSEAVSGRDGTFTIESFPSRTQRLTIQHRDYAASFADIPGDRPLPALLEIVLKRPGSIEGRIEPGPEVIEHVSVMDAAGGQSGSGVPPDGAFRFSELAPGEAHLSFAIRFPDAGVRVLHRTVVVRSEDTASFTLRVPPAKGIVEGTASAPWPVEGYHVVLDIAAREGDEHRQVEISSRGAFRLMDVAAGSATLRVSAYRPSRLVNSEPIPLAIEEGATVRQSVYFPAK
jgi:hypothetical protein